MGQTTDRRGGRDRTSAVRIIGGRWRGRRLTFSGESVRPTGDRIRETLFNWLDPVIRDARCLDLFAGTGALGIEALSRGAAACLFIERDPPAARQIRAHLDTLEATGGRVECADAQRFELASAGPFDVVFLDPPFATADFDNLCTLLERSGALAPDAHIYIESPRARPAPTLPAEWQWHRERETGQVRYGLARRQPELTGD